MIMLAVTLAASIFISAVFCSRLLYADGIDDLVEKLIETLTPVFQALQKLSWVVGAICIVIALINVILSPGGGRGSATSWAWIKGILIAVICINIVTGILGYVQTTIEDTGLNNDLSELTSYAAELTNNTPLQF